MGMPLEGYGCKMGKNVTKNKKTKRRMQQRRYMRAGALTLLCVLGVGLLAGMAMFNRNVKPNRDMQWYVRDGAVEVAAPAVGDGFATVDGATAAAAARDSEFVLPEEGMRALPRADASAVAQDDEPADLLAELEIAAPADHTEDADAAMDADSAPLEDAPELEPEDAVEAAPEIEDAAETEAEPEEEIPTGPVTLTITAAGDCTFSGEVGSKSNKRFLEYVENYGYDYFFKGVRSIFEADDLTIVNLEGPLTSSDKPKAHGYVFKADPGCVQILTGSSVELCNVANNHSQDYGTAGLKETAQVLDEAGVGYCGYTAAYEKTIKGVRVCALGFTKWDHSNEQIVQAVTEARKNCDLLIVNMHWGWERQYDYDDMQTALGHAAIDAGADLVIGTHPHVYQGIEKYKGKYIVYSLGNFSFAGNANPEDKRCLIFQQSFGFTPGMGIVQAGLVDEGINIIPATISSVAEKNDFQPTVLPAEQGAALLKSVASHSKNFNAKDTLWMKDNYLQENGLMKTKSGQAVQDATQLVNVDGDADAADADDAGAAGAESVLPTDIWEEDEPFFSMAFQEDEAA